MENSIFTYTQTCDTIFGCGAVKLAGEKAKELDMTKVLIVTDKGVYDTGLVAPVEEALKEQGIPYIIYKGVTIAKDTEIQEATEITKKEGIDGIIAVGGGASMDSAKAIALMNKNPEPMYQYFLNWNYKKPLPLICIPTTSGTGSENSIYAVTTYTGPDRPDLGLQHGCKADCLVKASLAICDPELTYKLPKSLTASTGVDAFAHAAESLTCIKPNPKSDLMDMAAIPMIMKWLPVAVFEPNNKEARYQMMLASNWAGMGFSDTLVHIGHAFSECMGAKFHVAHGISCAWALPETMRFSAKYVPDKVKMVADAMGLTYPKDISDEGIGNLVAEEIIKFMHLLEIKSIKDSGFTKEDTVSVYNMMLTNLCFPCKPGPISEDELKEWLGRVYDTYQ